MDFKRSTKPKEMKYENPSIRQILLRLMESISKTVELLPCGLSQHLFETMQTNEVLWEAPFPFHMKMVLSMLQTLLLKQCGCEATTQHLNEWYWQTPLFEQTKTPSTVIQLRWIFCFFPWADPFALWIRCSYHCCIRRGLVWMGS